MSEPDMELYFTFDAPAHSQEMHSLSEPPSIPPTTRRVGDVRVPLACIPCRSRHLKCGAETPICSRCIQDGKTCLYTKSRRGMKNKKDHRPNPPFSTGRKESHIPRSQTIQGRDIYRQFSSLSTGLPGNKPRYMTAGPATSFRRTTDDQTTLDQTTLLELYYDFFHKSSPYAPPKHALLSLMQSDPDSVKYLLPVMLYIGSLFGPETLTGLLRESALRHIEITNLPPTGFSVLALLLMAATVHGQDQAKKARQFLDRAIHLALELGMNFRSFATMESNPCLRECWRRTYWGLYISDCCMSGYEFESTFSLHTVDSNVELPCEERDYGMMIPPSRTLSEYDNREFADEQIVFSTFTYLIDLTRITGALLGVLKLEKGTEDLEAAVANVDAMLVNWKWHLPKEKLGVIDKNEEIDELLFCAHNLHNLLLIHIHRPLSRLFYLPQESTISIALPPPSKPPTAYEDRMYWLHTKKTLNAAEAVLHLHALPVPIMSHSPLSILGLPLCLTVYLSACTYMLKGDDWYRARDRIRLGLGGLKKMGEVWAVARKAETEIKQMAQSVFGSSAAPLQGMGDFPIDFETFSVEEFASQDTLSFLGILKSQDDTNMMSLK